MSDTPNLNLPYILAAQAQKHVTHNEAIRALDAIVQIGVADRDLTSPPSSPAEGARYIVAASATGGWAAHDHTVAAWQDGAWAFYEPNEGWLAWVADEDVLVAWDGAAWTTAGGGGGGAFTGLSDVPASYAGDGGALAVVKADETGLEFSREVALLGVNATPDATNKLAIASAASLFNHAGAGHQHKINKNAASDTASLLFQTSFSGRAEFGTTGDDDFHVKVSADGATWTEAIVIDKDNGRVGIGASSPSGAFSVGSAAGEHAYFFYDNADLSDTADGQALYIYRRAAEADNFIQLYVDQFTQAKIASDTHIRFQSYGGSVLLEATSGSFVLSISDLVVGEPWNATNKFLRIQGQITAAGASKYAQLQVDDGDDHLHLSREDGNVQGFKVDMPLTVDGPVKCKSYTVAGVPAASAGAGQMIYVSNEAGGGVIAFSDGTNWRRVTDRAVIS
jgi:hypothetical protein